MSELPRGWVEAQIDEVYSVARGGSPRPIKDFVTTNGTGLNWIRISDATAGGYRIQSSEQKITTDGLRKTREVFPGDLLLSNSMSFGKPYITDIYGCIHDGWLVLGGPGKQYVDTEFAYHCLRSRHAQKQFDAKASGTTVRNLNTELVSSVEIALPPLAEQKRIVAKLDALSTRSARARTDLTRIDTLVKRYKQAVLKSLIPDRLADEEQVKLSDVTEKIGSGATPKGGKSVYQQHGIPLIRSQNIHFEKFSWQGLAYIDDDAAARLKSVETLHSDVLLNITGASIGRASVLPKELIGARVNQHVAIIRCKREILHPNFLLLFLWTPNIQDWIWSANYGVTRQALTKSIIEAIEVPLPPLAEQKEIVRRIESAFQKIDRLAAETKRALELTGKLDEAVLAKAFRGELVPQNPNDEPASVLLDRIKADRAAQPKAKKRQGKKV